MTRAFHGDGDGETESSRSAGSAPSSESVRAEPDAVAVVRDGGIGVIPALNALLRHWRVLVVIPFLFAAVTAAVSLVIEPTYKATSIFVPESGSDQNLPAGLAGMAGQFGLSLGGGTRSAEFYGEVAKSRDLLERVLATPLPDHRTAAADDSATVLQQLEVEADSGGVVERGLEAVGRMIAIDVDIPTSIVRITVTSAYPGLAADVANRLVQLVDEFNTTSRQSQARRRREFIGERATEAGIALRQAEGRLDAFHERNRAWRQSPALATEEARLSRQVDIHRESFLALSRNLEQARIEEVNDAPVISIVQKAVAPHYRAHPRRTLMVLIAGVLGGAVALGWIALAEASRHLRRIDAPGYRELASRLDLFGGRRRPAAEPPAR